MIAQPGPWQKVVGDLIKDLESQVPESPDFRTNIDHKLREYEHVAGRLPTGGIVETPERINAFRATVRSKVEHLLNEDPSNRVLRETLQLLDNPGIRIKPLVGEKRKT